jgi:hypothetical protein
MLDQLRVARCLRFGSGLLDSITHSPGLTPRCQKLSFLATLVSCLAISPFFQALPSFLASPLLLHAFIGSGLLDKKDKRPSSRSRSRSQVHESSRRRRDKREKGGSRQGRTRQGSGGGGGCGGPDDGDHDNEISAGIKYLMHSADDDNHKDERKKDG